MYLVKNILHEIIRLIKETNIHPGSTKAVKLHRKSLQARAIHF